MKMNKIQCEMLESALEVIDTRGENVKPIHCDELARDNIDKYSANYARYNKSMYKLLDAGIIGYRDNDTRVKQLAYIKDVEKARELVKQYRAAA